MTAIPPQEIARLLISREARAAERRINRVRAMLLLFGLFVVVPIRLLTFGPTGGPGSLVASVAVLAIGLLASLALAWKMRDPEFPEGLAVIGIVLDFGIVAWLILAQVLAGVSGGSELSYRIHALFLPLGYAMNALSGMRLSHRQVLLSGSLCAGLLVEATLFDLLLLHLPYYAGTTVIAVSMVAVTTTASYFMVSKARTLLAEAASIESEAMRVRGVLSRYVSQPVAETVLQEDFSMATGRRQQVTVLFSDIRGFTRMAEAMPPEAVVSVLNAYFSRMVQVVFEFDGMLDKYIGDGMMVVFGAPIQHEDHALRAVQAALRMRQELAALNEERLARGEPALQIGIGLHTGEAVIGNIGTEQRLDYTAIGDTVNTASRIESLTKEFATDILLSAATHAAVMPRVEVEPLRGVPIRGKQTNLDLFKLVGLTPEGHAESPTTRVVPARTPTKILW